MNRSEERCESCRGIWEGPCQHSEKAALAIATILNILAQVLTWGAKALEFLSRNLWIVSLALTYCLYNEVKDRRRQK